MDLFFEPEDGTNMLLQNDSWLSMDYIPEDSTLHENGYYSIICYQDCKNTKYTLDSHV
jgi:hypothetical protein